MPQQFFRSERPKNPTDDRDIIPKCRDQQTLEQDESEKHHGGDDPDRRLLQKPAGRDDNHRQGRQLRTEIFENRFELRHQDHSDDRRECHDQEQENRVGSDVGKCLHRFCTASFRFGQFGEVIGKVTAFLSRFEQPEQFFRQAGFSRGVGQFPAIIEFLSHKEKKSLEEMMSVLNKKSGVFGMSGGLSSDFRDLQKAAVEGNEKARDAVAVFCYHVAKYIGSYVAAMNGVDAIAFTAGLGENDGKGRKEILSYLGYLGILDEEKNQIRGENVEITTSDSHVKVCVIPTNEELAIARETSALLR